MVTLGINMQQLNYRIREAFSNGESPDPMAEPNIPYLDRCYGLVPREVGCVDPYVITQPSIVPAEGQPAMSFTVGDAVLRDQYMFYFSNAATQRLVPIGVGWEDIFAATCKSIASGAAATLSKVKGRPQLLRVNDEFTLFGADTTHVFSDDSILLQAKQTDTNVITTGCRHNNRIIYAGFKVNQTAILDTEFQRVWTIAMKYSPNTDFSMFGEAFGDRVVVWSTPAGGDISVATDLEKAFLYNRALLSDLVNVAEDAFRRRQMGVAHFDWPGVVLYALPLGNRVMLYGDKAIGMLIPTDEGYITQKLIDVGIHSRSSVDGDDRLQVFVDTQGDVWYLQNEYIPRNMKYGHKVSALFDGDLDEDIRVVLDPRNYDCYITSPDTAYIVTEQRKFAEAQYRPWSLLEYNAGLYGPRQVGSSTFQLRSWVTDQDRNSRKTIQTVEVVRKGGSTISCYVSWRNKDTDAFVSSPSKKLNYDDAVNPIVTANQTKLVLEGTVQSENVVNKVRIKYLGRDLSHIRGLTEQPDEQI